MVVPLSYFETRVRVDPEHLKACVEQSEGIEAVYVTTLSDLVGDAEAVSFIKSNAEQLPEGDDIFGLYGIAKEYAKEKGVDTGKKGFAVEMKVNGGRYIILSGDAEGEGRPQAIVEVVKTEMELEKCAAEFFGDADYRALPLVEKGPYIKKAEVYDPEKEPMDSISKLEVGGNYLTNFNIINRRTPRLSVKVGNYLFERSQGYHEILTMSQC